MAYSSTATIAYERLACHNASLLYPDRNSCGLHYVTIATIIIISINYLSHNWDLTVKLDDQAPILWYYVQCHIPLHNF